MAQPVRDALLILNPRAGRVQALLSGGRLDRVRSILARHGIESEVARTDTPEAAEEAARGSVRQKRDVVVACGGDGTLNAVVNGLAGSQVPLTFLPAGTANVLAKELNLPRNLEHAASLLPGYLPRRIALGLLTTFEGGPHSRYFLSLAGAGPDGAIVDAVSHHLKRHTGMLAYWVEGLRQFATYSYPRFRITSADKEKDKEMEATMIVVGRTKHYGGPFRITPRADLYGNDFEILACATRSSFRYLSYLPLACFGRVDIASGTKFFRSKAFRCEAIDFPAAAVQVDGEPAGRLPAEFRVVPDALTLLTPQP